MQLIWSTLGLCFLHLFLWIKKDIYIIGGRSSCFDNPSHNIKGLKLCIRFDTKSKTWNEIEKMSKRRATLTSALYEERIFVSGETDIDSGDLKTVEAHDNVFYAWLPMQSMVSQRYGHIFLQ